MHKIGLPLVLLALLAGGSTGIALAQKEPQVPPAYEGIKNPLPWDDLAAIEGGRAIYQQSCQGCHGPRGSTLPRANFDTADFSGKLEARPDIYFWVLSEGRMSSGMPPFKSSLKEEQRWQVLFYLRSLGGPAAAPPAPSISLPQGSLTSPAVAQDGPRRITVEAGQQGFNGNPGEYRLAVTEGEEIEIVFVYGDSDPPF